MVAVQWPTHAIMAPAPHPGPGPLLAAVLVVALAAAPAVHPAAAPARPNPFGIGLVTPGTPTQLDLAHGLVGDGGWVLLTLPGVERISTGPQPSWTASLAAAYARNLSVAARLSPPWGQSHYRDEADDATATPVSAPRTNYTSLAAAFKAVVAGLLDATPAGRPLYLQLDNEPDLCYEWFCATKSASPLPSAVIAAEYAAFLVQTVAAIRSLGDARAKVGAAALAPGGCQACGCCGAQSCGAADKPGITGLTFQQQMLAAVPTAFADVDFLASHAYPASGIGYGFNAPFSQALPGLTYYGLELKAVGRPGLPVLITETGWASSRPGLPPCSEQDKADWTVDAYTGVWLNDSRVLGVMPFMLQDAQWGDKDGYDYVRTTGDILPVYTAVQQLRQSRGYS